MAEVGTLNMDPSGEINNIEDILKNLDIPNTVDAILGLDKRDPGDLIDILTLMRSKGSSNDKKY